jgi:hypothetical protein
MHRKFERIFRGLDFTGLFLAVIFLILVEVAHQSHIRAAPPPPKSKKLQVVLFYRVLNLI